MTFFRKLIKQVFVGGITAPGSGTLSEAYGANASAGDLSTSVGYNANANGTDSVAVGNSANADADRATVVGEGAQSLADDGTAIGTAASANEKGTSLGAASVSTFNAVACGRNARATSDNSVAVGDSAFVDTGSNHAMAIGRSATVPPSCSGSIAVGRNAACSLPNELQVGGAGAAIDNMTINGTSLVLLHMDLLMSDNGETGLWIPCRVGGVNVLKQVTFNVSTGVLSITP